MNDQKEILARLQRIETKVDHILDGLERNREQHAAAILDRLPCASTTLEHQVDHIGNDCRFASRTYPR